MQNFEKYQSMAEQYLALWGLKPSGPAFSTHTSFLWPVEANGAAFMLKIVDPQDDEANAPDILKIYNGNGAISLVRHEGNVQLLERAVSIEGQPTLEQMVLTGRDDDATHIICDVIEKLHAQIKGKPLPQSYTRFADRMTEMLKYMHEGRVASGELPLFQEGHHVAQALVQQQKPTEMLLHGDLHHFNLLFSANRGWLAIDPKGIFGPRAYEYVIALCNPTLHTEIVATKPRMHQQSKIMSERSGIAQNILLQFAFVHALQVAAWCLSKPDQHYWLACAKTAHALMRA